MYKLTDEQKVIWVKGLLIDCPMGKALADCPAKDVRALPIGDRLKLVDEMHPDQITQIIAHHRQCLQQREGARPGLLE